MSYAGKQYYYVRKKADSKEEQLIRDCRKGLLDKRERTRAIVSIFRSGEYLYMRVCHRHWNKEYIERSTTGKFCKVMGFDMNNAYMFDFYDNENHEPVFIKAD